MTQNNKTEEKNSGVNQTPESEEKKAGTENQSSASAVKPYTEEEMIHFGDQTIAAETVKGIKTLKEDEYYPFYFGENNEFAIHLKKGKKGEIDLELHVGIRVKRTSAATKPGPLAGFGDIQFGPITLQDVRLLKKNDIKQLLPMTTPGKRAGSHFPAYMMTSEVRTMLLDIIGPEIEHKREVAENTSVDKPVQNINPMEIEMSASKIFPLLFSAATKIFGHNITTYANGKVRSVDIDNIRFLTQNPDKNNIYGERARKGERIMWVIKLTPGSSEGMYLGRVEEKDGRVEMVDKHGLVELCKSLAAPAAPDQA